MIKKIHPADFQKQVYFFFDLIGFIRVSTGPRKPFKKSKFQKVRKIESIIMIKEKSGTSFFEIYFSEYIFLFYIYIFRNIYFF